MTRWMNVFADLFETDADRFHDHPPRILAISGAPGCRKRRRNRLMAAMTVNTMTTTRMEKAAATPSSSSVIFSRMRTVMRVQLMEIRKIVALMAVIDRMKTTPRPAKKAGRISGSVIRRKVVSGAGPEAEGGLLDAGIDLLEDGHRRADPGRAVPEDIAGDDDDGRSRQHKGGSLKTRR